jgi:hypothetical protein
MPIATCKSLILMQAAEDRMHCCGIETDVEGSYVWTARRPQ